MRAPTAWLVLMLATAPAGGCARDDKGAVLLHVGQRSSDLVLVGSSYGSSTAGVGPVPDQLLFTATSSEGLLQLRLPATIQAGDTVTLPVDDERVHFHIDYPPSVADWGNSGGSVYVISTVPMIIGLIDVPMVARGGIAAGSFVFNGNGTFRCDSTGDCSRIFD